MALEIHDVEQNSDAWLRLRAGVPTASCFGDILAKGEGKTRKSYMRRLAGEIITGEPAETYESEDMRRGRAMEQEALSTYAFTNEVEVTRVGFVKNGPKGCSPDGLVGSNGLVEAKSKKPSVLIECILRGTFPPEHVAQCQGALWVCEREWIDLICYWPGMPPFTVRATRDEPYIATLATEVDRFNQELADMVEKVRQYGRAA